MRMLYIEGKIINYDGESQGRIEIDTETGLIQSIGEPTGQADIVLSDSCLIFPGFVDLHVHMREDQSGKLNYKEDFISGSLAAINGGVVAAMDLTNNFVPLTSAEAYLERKKLADKKSLIDLILAAPIGPNTKPFSFPAPYKLFMAHSVGDLFFNSKKEIEEAVKKYEGQFINFHCEDPEILDKYKNAATNLERRPPEAEISGTEFALELIEKYNIKGKICHVSTKDGLELIKRAKAKGVSVTCEVTPHHLYFDESANLTMNPPLRTQQDRAALIAGLKNGDIDFLATDHAPHTKEERDNGVSGLPQLDTYGPFTAWLMTEHSFTPQEIARISSYNPGKVINEFTSRKFGKILPGFTGSITILDMSKKALILKENLETKAGWSPFENQLFAGSVKYAIIRSRVYEDTHL
jgi:dihydroorotase